MGRVILEHLVKAYREASGVEARAVDGISLVVEPGEFMVLVGPSGCGKSTTLRLIAGLDEVTSGTISIDGRVVNEVAPKDRDIAMVFQNYALYPHLSVYDNLAFGLRLRKLPRPEIDRRVRGAAALLGLESLLARKPKALSGGQRQRVAVGRAIVRQPKVFLFDEPLSNLDAKMRTATRGEISRLHARLGATMIYVTHDQVEAMTMGDRICVMRDGRIMQVAEPMELYHRPNHRFVAGFIGSPPMNLFEGRIERRGADWVFLEDSAAAAGVGEARQRLKLPLTDELGRMAEDRLGQAVVLGIRPEDVREAGHPAPVPAGPDDPAGEAPGGGGAKAYDSARWPVFTATLELAETMGAETYLHASTATGALVARVRSAGRHELGRAHLFDGATGEALGHASG
jgi:multiple sugar transport system ATP-binding protein